MTFVIYPLCDIQTKFFISLNLSENANRFIYIIHIRTNNLINVVIITTFHPLSLQPSSYVNLSNLQGISNGLFI